MMGKKSMFYWESNREWFTFVNDEPRLTNKAPDFARKSYEEYQRYYSKEMEEKRAEFFRKVEEEVDYGDDDWLIPTK